MLNLKAKLIAMAWLLCATAACSQSAKKPASTGGTDSATGSAPADPNTQGNAATVDCSKVFAPSDVAGILAAPIQIGPDGAYAVGCSFEGAGASVAVRVDPSIEMPWNSVTASSDFVDLPGVGDHARRRASNGREVLSKKGDLYCGATFSMQSTDTKLSAEELSKRLGALCNKLFAASR